MDRRVSKWVAVLIVGSVGTAALAQERADGQLPPVVKELIDCRAITDGQQRLACYDQRTDAFAQAQSAGDLFVADRQQIREERRGLFGLSLPKLRIFGGGDDDKGVEEPSSFEGVVKAVRGSRTALVVELEQGGVWAQTDQRYAGPTPVPGDKITIRRAALGSYMARVENKGGFRAKRLR